jgi:hypothetical protein
MDENTKEMIAALEREGLDYDISDTIMFYPYIKHESKDVKLAKQIVKDFGYKLVLYMPGSKEDDKDAEYEIVKR